MSSGPVIWDFRTRFNIEIVVAQSQASVRQRTVRIKYSWVRFYVLNIIMCCFMC